MRKLNLSEEAIALLHKLGFSYDETLVDDDYIAKILDVCDKEDVRIGLLASELELAGITYPQGIPSESLEDSHYLSEIYNAIDGYYSE